MCTSSCYDSSPSSTALRRIRREIRLWVQGRPEEVARDISHQLYRLSQVLDDPNGGPGVLDYDIRSELSGNSLSQHTTVPDSPSTASDTSAVDPERGGSATAHTVDGRSSGDVIPRYSEVPVEINILEQDYNQYGMTDPYETADYDSMEVDTAPPLEPSLRQMEEVHTQDHTCAGHRQPREIPVD